MRVILGIILGLQLFTLGYIAYMATDWIRHLTPRQFLYECLKRGLISYDQYAENMKALDRFEKGKDEDD